MIYNNNISKPSFLLFAAGLVDLLVWHCYHINHYHPCYLLLCFLISCSYVSTLHSIMKKNAVLLPKPFSFKVKLVMVGFQLFLWHV